MKTRIN